MNILKPLSIALASLILLTGCAGASTPDTSASNDTDEINLQEGDGSIVVEFPDFASAGEEGEPSAEAWTAFAEIADNSKFKLLEDGGYEYFGMYEEPYLMIYDPAFPAGVNWTVYYFENDGTVNIEYDVFEMSAYNSGLELYLYGDISERPISGAAVSLNPDGTYTVKVPEQGYSIRYFVEDGYITGRGVWDEDSETFLGYSFIQYGIDEEYKTLVADAYKLAVESGETFVVSAEDQTVEELPSDAQVSNGDTSQSSTNGFDPAPNN